MGPLNALILPQALWQQMRDDVAAKSPQEACGLLAGLEGRALAVLPVPNALQSEVRYRMDPRDQWRAFQEIENQGWELLGIYHSHPRGPAGPSQTDIDEAYYPEVVYLIWSPKAGDSSPASGDTPPEAGEWRCRGYRIQDGTASELPLIITG